MGPPKVLSPHSADSCADLTSVHLDAFASLPDLKTLSPFQQAKVRDLYQNIGIWTLIDEKYGNQDRHLDAKEVDLFLKANPQKNSALNTCSILNTARQYASHVSEFVKMLRKADLSDVDLTPLYSLPELKKFIGLPDVTATDQKQAIQKMKASIVKADFSPELKKLLLGDPIVFNNYFLARNLIKGDSNKDEKLSVSEVTANLTALGLLLLDDPNLNPAVILTEARNDVLQSGQEGLLIRKRLGLPKEEGNFIDSGWVLLMSKIAPDFMGSDPKLKLLRDLVVKKTEDNKIDLTDEARDGVINKDEFIQNILVKALSFNAFFCSPVVLFYQLKQLEETLQVPLDLWPKDLRTKLEDQNPRSPEYSLVLSAQDFYLNQWLPGFFKRENEQLKEIGVTLLELEPSSEEEALKQLALVEWMANTYQQKVQEFQGYPISEEYLQLAVESYELLGQMAAFSPFESVRHRTSLYDGHLALLRYDEVEAKILFEEVEDLPGVKSILENMNSSEKSQ